MPGGSHGNPWASSRREQLSSLSSGTGPSPALQWPQTVQNKIEGTIIVGDPEITGNY